ncbi:MAG: hypothetical protein HKN39_01980 [Flavobacteriales bacterium]|nr:hypothetical protein [Flavobacteriales bacterium]
MARRALPGIPTGSMADIAFLLLVFWLMTTTLESDIGIMRQLPPIDNEAEPETVKMKNVYEVMVNFRNELLVEGELGQVNELKSGAMEFLTNTGVFEEKPGDENLTSRTWVRKADVQAKINSLRSAISTAESEDISKSYQKSLDNIWQPKMDAINFFGEYRELVPAAVISLQNDKGTTYDTYIQVQNELASAVNQLRDDLCQKTWKINFDDLSDKVPEDKRKIKAVRQVFPQRVSEAEPKDVNN